MKSILIFLIIISIGALISAFAANVQKKSNKKSNPAETMADLRKQIFESDPHNIGINDFTSSNQVWGVVMETGYANATVTLVALIDGTTSIYFSSGGGIIGGQGHEKVRKAAHQMALIADPFVKDSNLTSVYPLPQKDETIFYILTKNGKFTKRALERDLGEKHNSFSPLFYAGQDVITELRKTIEKK